MSLAQRFERRLEGLVGGAFARVFKGQVEPAEIGSALEREAMDKRNVMANGDLLCPNRYRVTLAPSDYERFGPWEQPLANSLAELVQDYLDENGCTTIGDIEVYLVRDETLHTGVFGVASRMESGAGPRRRPHDSLSLPAVRAPADGSGPNPNPSPSSSPAPAPELRPRYSPPPRPASGGRRAAGALVASLVVDQADQRYTLRVGSNVVGRGADADLQLLDQGISRRHLDVQFDGNFATAYDLGSTNGTAVNGHEVGSHVLQHGDVIRIGRTRLVFQLDQ